MGASVLQLDNLTDSDIGAWRELSEAALEPNPFFDPDFVLPAAAELDSTGVGLLVARQGDDWTGCMPVVRQRGWRRVPTTGLVVWRHLYCFLGTPLLRPDQAEDAARFYTAIFPNSKAGSSALTSWPPMVQSAARWSP